MKYIKQTSIFILIALLLTSCVHVQPHAHDCLTDGNYGFWGGLWHGIIAPIAFIVSWFNDDIAVWAVNNNGGWYTFGFLLGVGAFAGSATKASSKK